MRQLKIIFSVLFVVCVSLFIVRACVEKKQFQFERMPISVTVEAPPKSVPVKEAKMAIILDDWGNNYSLFKYALEVDRPLTLAVLPNLPSSQKIAQEAFDHHLGVMLPLPMQPKNQKKGLEPHTILTTTSDQEILEFIKEAIASVLHTDGVNNHMGSAATADERVMRTVLTELKKRNLFFVDSHVSNDTVAPKIAKELRLPFISRDVFIDNELNRVYIKNQLRRAKTLALRLGKVVVIGHDKKITLSAIRELVPEFEQAGIRFVLVKELLESNGG